MSFYKFSLWLNSFKTLYYCIHGFEPCNPLPIRQVLSSEANALELFCCKRLYKKRIPNSSRAPIARRNSNTFLFYNTHISLNRLQLPLGKHELLSFQDSPWNLAVHYLRYNCTGHKLHSTTLATAAAPTTSVVALPRRQSRYRAKTHYPVQLWSGINM